MEDSEFPMDGSVEDASNYCRDPDVEGRTWCYTMNPEFRWEYCNFPSCSGSYLLTHYFVSEFLFHFIQCIIGHV